MTREPAALRPATPEDAAGIAGVYARYVLETVASFEEVPPDAEVIRERMLAAPRRPWFVAVRDGRVVGFACASQHRTRPAYRWSTDVSVYLAQTEHRQGTGRALYGSLLSEVLELGYVSAFATIALPNPASVGLHEALGFTAVGVYRRVGYKLGAWRDVGWWQLALTDSADDPEEPRAWCGAGA